MIKQIKQVIIIRKDLNMPAGKLAAQASHAAVNAVLSLQKLGEQETILEWLATGFTKVCLEVNSEEELKAIEEKAIELNLVNSRIIVDSGRTVFNGIKTKTCLAIGPADANLINKVTGNLALYKG